MPRVTQAEIGRRLGLAQITVSKALRGDSDIALETKRRVRELAEQLGYVANPYARTLAEGAARIIGIHLTSFRGQHSATLVEGLDRAIRQHGYVPLLAPPGDPLSANVEVMRVLVQYRVRGVVLAVPHALWHPAAIDLLRRNSIPLVLMGENSEPASYSVFGDDFDGLQQSVRYLHQFGHRHISLASLAYQSPNPVAQTKENGFLEGLRQVGLPADPASILRFEEGQTLEQVREHLRQRPKITAFAAIGDSVALDLIRELRALGYDVPRDFSVIGHGDDIQYVEYFTPPLTTMTHDVMHSGELAVEMLFEQINGGAPPRRVALPNRIIERQSVTPPRKRQATSGSPG